MTHLIAELAEALEPLTTISKLVDTYGLREVLSALCTVSFDRTELHTKHGDATAAKSWIRVYKAILKAHDATVHHMVQ